MKECIFQELGYFTVSTCEALKKALDGKTYMNFQVAYSNHAGNCTLIVKTDYEAEEQEVKKFFIHAAMSELAALTHKAQ